MKSRSIKQVSSITFAVTHAEMALRSPSWGCGPSTTGRSIKTGCAAFVFTQQYSLSHCIQTQATAHPSCRAAWASAWFWPWFPMLDGQHRASGGSWMGLIGLSYFIFFFHCRPTLILLGEIFSNSYGFCAHSFFLEGAAAEGR